MIVSVPTSSSTVLMIEEHEANSQRTQEEGQYTKAAQWNGLGCLIDPWHALTGACVFHTTKECPIVHRQFRCMVKILDVICIVELYKCMMTHQSEGRRRLRRQGSFLRQGWTYLALR
jgi:hypothetical protein